MTLKYVYSNDKIPMGSRGWYIYGVRFLTDRPNRKLPLDPKASSSYPKPYRTSTWWLVTYNGKVVFGICNHKYYAIAYSRRGRDQYLTGKITPRQFISLMMDGDLEITNISAKMAHSVVPDPAWEEAKNAAAWSPPRGNR